MDKQSGVTTTAKETVSARMNADIERYLSAGISLLPCKPDKTPALASWKDFQSRLPTAAEISTWTPPVAAIGGIVSGGVLCIDFDDKGSNFPAWCVLVKELDPSLPPRLVYQQTPSGGYHVIFRSKAVVRNTKLAQRVGTQEDKDKDGSIPKIVCLIETRGEGGYFLVSPSPGYVWRLSDISKVQMLTEDDTEVLLSCARSLDQMPKEACIPREQQAAALRAGRSPFDDFDSRSNCVALLERHGWKSVSKIGSKILLRRPGKDRGISASWNHVPDRFYCFSSSTGFELGHIYKASSVYAHLEHGGDFVAAAKALYREGYGDRKESPSVAGQKPVDVDTAPSTQTICVSDFEDKIRAFYKAPRESGVRLRLPQFDQCLRFGPGQLTVITGIPTHGKSEFVDFVMILLAKIHRWNFIVFSPENYPLEIHFNKLAEKFTEKNMWGATEHELQDAIAFLDVHFEFVDATEEELSLESIMIAVEQRAKKRKFDCLLIDPWNEIDSARPRDMNESDYIGVCLRRLRKFARKKQIHVFVVAHPTKMQKDKNTGKYVVPGLYDISSSANWYNKVDNGICIYRDFEAETTQAHILKVKYKNYGALGKVDFKYEKDSGIYREIEPMFENSFCND